ncbi:hypothetical protein LQ318_02195 [Aliifodinibius salicampi]|uniref:Uncharacterized protein n=1 Tax=Fodinibius salicampi TaxID=1920655 RepID=A0ABT3PV51_9BACT|nr:hypothetical protein [Fodinibius salicampi]MCW9711703.1 hypothetical protein [Fodinibius salicampi]
MLRATAKVLIDRSHKTICHPAPEQGHGGFSQQLLPLPPPGKPFGETMTVSCLRIFWDCGKIDPSAAMVTADCENLLPQRFPSRYRQQDIDRPALVVWIGSI